jgi:hypothetical protein
MIYWNTEQRWQKQIIKDLAKEYGISPGVVRGAVYFPFLFLKRCMKDKDHVRPMRFMNFGLFAPKPRFMMGHAEVELPCYIRLDPEKALKRGDKWVVKFNGRELEIDDVYHEFTLPPKHTLWDRVKKTQGLVEWGYLETKKKEES